MEISQLRSLLCRSSVSSVVDALGRRYPGRHGNWPARRRWHAGCRTGSAHRYKAGQQLLQALDRLVDIFGYVVVQRPVTVSGLLVDGVLGHQGGAFAFGEGDGLQADVAGMPSNSTVWTIPSGDSVPWNTPWKKCLLPSASEPV